MRVMWVPKEVLGIIVKYCVEGNLGKLCRLRLVSPFWRDSIDNYIFYLDAKKVSELNVLFEKQKYRTVVYRDGFGNHAYRVKIADINSETLRYANYSYRRFYTGTLAILFNYSRRIKNIKKHVDDEKTYCYTAELKFIYSDSIKSRNTLQILWNDKPVTEQDYRQAITQNFLISLTKKLIH